MGKALLSALVALIIGGGGALLAAATQPTGMTDTAWLVAMVTGLMAGAKDLQAFLSQPPGKK